ncbi:MAG: hypothetical protein ACOYB0_11105, partial [Polynucleobacter sp.]
IADTSTLEKGIQGGSDLTTIYDQMCQRIIDSLKKQELEKLKPKQPPKRKFESPQMEVIITPITYPIRDAERVCQNLNAQEPEIRTWDDHARISTAAAKKGIYIIKAGVKYDQATKTYLWKSDGFPVDRYTPFTEFWYGGDYIGKWHKANDWAQDQWVRGMAHNFFVSYHDPQANFRIRMSDNNVHNHHDYIVCERKTPEDLKANTVEDHMLFQLMGHNCERDRESIVKLMAYTVHEARVVTNLNISLTGNTPDYKAFFPQVKEYEQSQKVVHDRARRSTNENSDSQITNEDIKTDSQISNANSDPKITTNTADKDSTIDYDSLDNPYYISNEDYDFEEILRLIDEEINNKTLSQDPLERQRRLAPAMLAIGGTIAAVTAANIATSASTGAAPLSWIGQA